MIKYKITKINDSKVSTLREKYPNIEENDLKRIIAIDPTSKIESDYAGQYGDWLVLMFSKGETFNEPLELSRTLELYNRVKGKVDLQYRNIFNFKSLEEFKKFVQESGKADFSASEMKNNKPEGANVIYKNGACTVWHPTTYEASKWLRGNNANWCTGDHRSDSMWNSYSGRGNIYIIISNSDEDDKYQFFVPEETNKIREFRDADDNSVNMRQIIDKFDLEPMLEQLGIDNKLIDIEALYDYLFNLKTKGNPYTCEDNVRQFARDNNLDEEAVVEAWNDWVDNIQPWSGEDDAYQELQYYRTRQEYLEECGYSEYSGLVEKTKEGNAKIYKDLFSLNLNDFLKKLHYYKYEEHSDDDNYNYDEYDVMDMFINNADEWFENNYYRLGIYDLFANYNIAKFNQLVELYNAHEKFGYKFFLNEKENVCSLLNASYDEIKDMKICKKFKRDDDYACTVDQMIHANYLLTEPFFRIRNGEFENKNYKIKFQYLSLEDFLNSPIVKDSFAYSLIEYENYKKAGLENLYLKIMELYKEDLLQVCNSIKPRSSANDSVKKYKITKIEDHILKYLYNGINISIEHEKKFVDRFAQYYKEKLGIDLDLDNSTSFLKFCDICYKNAMSEQEYQKANLNKAVMYFEIKSGNWDFQNKCPKTENRIPYGNFNKYIYLKEFEDDFPNGLFLCSNFEGNLSTIYEPRLENQNNGFFNRHKDIFNECIEELKKGSKAKDYKRDFDEIFKKNNEDDSIIYRRGRTVFTVDTKYWDKTLLKKVKEQKMNYNDVAVMCNNMKLVKKELIADIKNKLDKTTMDVYKEFILKDKCSPVFAWKQQLTVFSSNPQIPLKIVDGKDISPEVKEYLIKMLNKNFPDVKDINNDDLSLWIKELNNYIDDYYKKNNKYNFTLDEINILTSYIERDGNQYPVYSK